MLSDIEIAHGAKMKPITEIAAGLGIENEDIEPYGCLLYTSPRPRDS